MIYSTRVFKLNKKLDEATYNFLLQFHNTRRIKRTEVGDGFGADGEFYTFGVSDASQINNITLPTTQPSVFCGWAPSKNRGEIIWDDLFEAGCEKEWICYLISKILAPRGYVLNGKAEIKTPHYEYNIEIKDNVVNKKRLIVDYSINKLLGTLLEKKSPLTKTTDFIKDYKEKEEKIIKDKIKELKKELNNVRIKNSEQHAEAASLMKKYGLTGSVPQFVKLIEEIRGKKS